MPDLPTSFVRGDTYYVAAGSYGSHTFSTPTSGTSLITIQAPTTGDHCTDTGWNAAYIGQAVFTAPLAFGSDYWTLNGTYRTDWRSGYGFKVNHRTSPGVANNSCAAIIANAGGCPGSPVNHITIKYVEVQGSGSSALTGESAVGGQGTFEMMFSGGINVGNYVGYVYAHDCGLQCLTADSAQQFMLEYSWLENSWCSNHCELIGMRGWGTPNTGPWTIRYNYLGNSKLAGFITQPCACTITMSGDWDIYGNVFFWNSAEDGLNRDISNQVMWMAAVAKTGPYTMRFVNNTVSDLNPFGVATITPNMGAGITTAIIENNLTYNFPGGGALVTGIGTTIQVGYNSYFSAPALCSADPNPIGKECVSNTNPFVNVPKTKSVMIQDFHLSRDTAAWTPLSDVARQPDGFVETLSKDRDGVTRTSSRGAFQFAGATSTLPAPPTGLAAIVH